MPTLTAKTIDSEKAWTSPDGKISIYKVHLNSGGEKIEASTYSKAVAEKGFEGELESYEKPSKKQGYPPQLFVKQAQKEGSSKPSREQRDENYTMYLSYAKDIAVALIASNGDIDKDQFKKHLALVSQGGKALYDRRPGQEGEGEKAQDDEGEKEDVPAEEDEDTLTKVLGDVEQLRIEDSDG